MFCSKSKVKTPLEAACKRDKGILHEVTYYVDTLPFGSDDVERGSVKVHKEADEASEVVAVLSCGSMLKSAYLVPPKDIPKKQKEKDGLGTAEHYRWICVQTPCWGYVLRSHPQSKLALLHYDGSVVRRGSLLRRADEDDWEMVSPPEGGDVIHCCSCTAVICRRGDDDDDDDDEGGDSEEDRSAHLASEDSNMPMFDAPSSKGREVYSLHPSERVCVCGLVKSEGRLWYRVVLSVGHVFFLRAPKNATVKDPFPKRSPIALVTNDVHYYKFYLSQAGQGRQNYANFRCYESVRPKGSLLKLEDGECGDIYVLPSRNLSSRQDVIMPIPCGEVMYSPYQLTARVERGSSLTWYRILNPVEGYIQSHRYLSTLGKRSPILIGFRKYVTRLLDWVTLDVLFGFCCLLPSKVPSRGFMIDLLIIGHEEDIPNLAPKRMAVEALIGVLEDHRIASKDAPKDCSATAANSSQVNDDGTSIDATIGRFREVHRRLGDLSFVNNVEAAVSSLPPHPFRHKKFHCGTEFTGVGLYTILVDHLKKQERDKRERDRQSPSATAAACIPSGKETFDDDTPKKKSSVVPKSSVSYVKSYEIITEQEDNVTYRLDCGNANIRLAVRAEPSLQARTLSELRDGDCVCASHRLIVKDAAGSTMEWLRTTSPSAYVLFTMQSIARPHVHQAARDRNCLWVAAENTRSHNATGNDFTPPPSSPPPSSSSRVDRVVSQPPLPATVYRSDECPICFWKPADEEGSEAGDKKIMFTLQCGHQMCSACCKILASQRPQCPVCRLPMHALDVSALTQKTPPAEDTPADSGNAAAMTSTSVSSLDGEWSLERAREMVRVRWQEEPNGGRRLMMRGEDGVEFAANITSTGNARIVVSPGAQIMINGRRVENTEGCQQQ